MQRIRYAIGIVVMLLFGEIMAQNTLSGKVLDSLTHEPIPYANVFLANTSIGSVTNGKGEFEIHNIPHGKFDVTISFVGYVTQQFALDFSDKEYTITINLAQQVIQLNEIYVKADTAGWKQNFGIFKTNFVGTTRNASHVHVINPRILYFYFDPTDRVLIGHAKKSIEIENRALGYKVFYELDHFQLDYVQGKLEYFGIPRFEPMQPKGKKETKRWDRERKRAYFGSFSHLIQTLRRDQLEESGFELIRIHIVPNRKRPPEAFLAKRIQYWKEKLNSGESVTVTGRMDDSLSYYLKLRSMPKVVDSIGTKVLSARELYAPGREDLLQYTGRLLVTFHENEEPQYSPGRPPARVQRSIVTLFGKQLHLYNNGYYEDIHDVFLEGYLAWNEKIADLLPLEYSPPKK